MKYTKALEEQLRDTKPEYQDRLAWLLWQLDGYVSFGNEAELVVYDTQGKFVVDIGSKPRT